MNSASTAHTAVQLGMPVAPSAAKRPQRTTLKGRAVTIVSLDPLAHAQALYEGSHGEDKE